MVVLRIEPYLFSALRAGFETAASDDTPVDIELLDRVRSALNEASAAALPGLPIIIALESTDELDALAVCFEVGSQLHPDVTDDQWDAIQSAMEQEVHSC
jgi:hypothetical protein